MIIETPVMDRCFHSFALRDDRMENAEVWRDDSFGYIYAEIPHHEISPVIRIYIEWQCLTRDNRQFTCWGKIHEHFDIEKNEHETYPFTISISDEPVEGAVVGINRLGSNSYENMLEFMQKGFDLSAVEMNGMRFWWWVNIVNEDGNGKEVPFEETGDGIDVTP